MCGILGYIGKGEYFSRERFAEATNIVSYRGPDDYGYTVLNNKYQLHQYYSETLEDCNVVSKDLLVGFGFRRLSIIDLSQAAHQPMLSPDNNYVIVYNGEVYNYLELRSELEKLNHKFVSGNDTEVVLHSYMEWGVSAFEKFNGMFAFAILDMVNKKVICSRDRYGIKPFYYFFDTESFIFASEIKQILHLLNRKPTINYKVLFDFLSLGAYGNETHETFFKDIYRLYPGHYFEIDISEPARINLKEKTWKDKSIPEIKYNCNEKIIFEDLYNLLEDSIRIRLRSDVPIGTCLSGGIDSSALVCITDRILRQTPDSYRHKVFIIKSQSGKYDESQFAQMVIDITNTDAYFRVPTGADLKTDLEKFIWHNDEPLIKASMFGGYYVYKLAKESGVTVVLDGQGADEIFGGYFQLPYIESLYNSLKKGQVGTFIRQFKINRKNSNLSRTVLSYYLLKFVMKNLAHIIMPETFRPNLWHSVKDWLNRDFYNYYIKKSNVITKRFNNNNIEAFGDIIKQQCFEHLYYTNLPGILRQVDRNSMAFSIEARVPFLDHRLVDFVMELPSEFILKDGYTKYALRGALKNVIPEPIRLRRDKIGFFVDEWLLIKDSQQFVKSLILDYKDEYGIFNLEGILKKLPDIFASNERYNSLFWRTLNVIVWINKFIK
ncbi:MAG: asparagine synthase (glutamine-hydrolyzing) [Ignavibacteria bacterium]